jgi:hypothetical protein
MGRLNIPQRVLRLTLKVTMPLVTCGCAAAILPCGSSAMKRAGSFLRRNAAAGELVQMAVYGQAVYGGIVYGRTPDHFRPTQAR